MSYLFRSRSLDHSIGLDSSRLAEPAECLIESSPARERSIHADEIHRWQRMGGQHRTGGWTYKPSGRVQVTPEHSCHLRDSPAPNSPKAIGHLDTLERKSPLTGACRCFELPAFLDGHSYATRAADTTIGRLGRCEKFHTHTHTHHTHKCRRKECPANSYPKFQCRSSGLADHPASWLVLVLIKTLRLPG